MKRLSLAAALCASLCAHAFAEDAPKAEKPAEAPKYDRNNIYDTSVMTPYPYSTFTNVAKFKENKECESKAKNADERANCPQYSFVVPYSMSNETVRVGKDIRQAWQRFEDRYYWRAMVNLNNPGMYISHCLVGDWAQKNPANKPDVVINTDDSMYPADIAGKIPKTAVKDDLQMDSYGIMPNVSNADYCDSMSFDFTLMYLPGECNYAGSILLFCIQGEQETLNPLAPRPIAFQYGTAVQRVKDATEHAEKVYQEQYQQDVLKAVKPTAQFFPLMWDNMLSGAVIAPAQTLTPNPDVLTKKGQEAGKAFGGIFEATAPIYYAQGITSNALTLPLRAHILPTVKDVLVNPNPPGVWKLEEYKRTFPQEPAPIYERFGYTNLFSAWTRPTVKLLPEPVSAKPMRQMIYMAIGNNIYHTLLGPVTVPVPAPVLIKEYAAGLPYAGLQSHFTWNSVPEGYEVPRVSGTPPLDYPLPGKK